MRMSESLSKSCFRKQKKGSWKTSCTIILGNVTATCVPGSKFASSSTKELWDFRSWNFCSQQGPMSKSQELQPQILTDPILCLKIRDPTKTKLETVHLHITNKTLVCRQNNSKTVWNLGHVFLVFWGILLSCDMT